MDHRHATAVITPRHVPPGAQSPPPAASPGSPVITAPYLDHSRGNSLGESRRLYREVEAATRADLQQVLRTGEHHRWSTWIVDDRRPAAVLSRSVPYEPPRLATASDATDGRFIVLAVTASVKGRWRPLPASFDDHPWVAWGADANGLVIACASQEDARGIAARIVLERSVHTQDDVLSLRSWS
jgi:hypothetical protein